MTRVFELAADPLVDVDAPVAEVFPDSEPRWALPAMSPGVDRGQRDVEVFGEFLGGDERFEMLHASIMRPNPVSRVSGTLQLDAHRDRTCVGGFAIERPGKAVR